MDPKPDICRHLRITGRVQGVGYRDWAVQAARSLGLSGWVRNRSDRSVEAVVAGPSDAVEAFVAACRDGPPVARVDGVESRVEPMPGFTGFGWRETV